MIAPSESESVSLTSSPHKSVTGYVSVQGSSNVSVLVPPIPVTEVENDVTVDVEDLALEGVKAASNLDCQSGLNEADVFQTSWMKSQLYRSLLPAIYLAVFGLSWLRFCHSSFNRPSGVTSGALFDFPFCQGSLETTTLWGQEKKRVVSVCLISRMKQWQSGDLVSLRI